jgi:hypothetical protein
MVPNQSNADDWVAAVSSYVRNNFGNSAGFVSAADVRRVRTATTSRRNPWTVAELEASLPKLLISDDTWKLSASHNTELAPRALTMTSWSSQTPQAPGMWFQVELPQPAQVTEIQFTSTGGGRGGGGGGARGAAPGAAPAGPPAPPAQPVTGYPRGYKVETSLDGSKWALATEGTGTGSSTIITFRPVRAKFVRLTQTATADGAPPLSIQQLRLFEAPAPATR